MRQFEIWTTAGGTSASKPRPSIIIQKTAFEAFDSVSVIPLTSEVSANAFRVAVGADSRNGLTRDSFAMVDKITTIKKTGLSEKTGVLNTAAVSSIKAKLTEYLGL
jgi:mRNA interferase MazF